MKENKDYIIYLLINIVIGLKKKERKLQDNNLKEYHKLRTQLNPLHKLTTH